MLLQPPHIPSEDRAPFELKGSLFTLTVLHLFDTRRSAIEQHLAEKIKQAPGFFANTPMVIDLEGLADVDHDFDFDALYDLLRSYGMVPVGIRNGSPELQRIARQAGLPVLPENRSNSATKKLDREHTPARSRIFKHHVRSGQQIYAPDGDLIVLGTVSAGAEVIADGSIHIYGTLRGRALAGVKGDTEARIFCHSLEAELISIAGRYRINEQIEPADLGRGMQVHLLEDRLVIEPLTR